MRESIAYYVNIGAIAPLTACSPGNTVVRHLQPGSVTEHRFHTLSSRFKVFRPRILNFLAIYLHALAIYGMV
jgi:hypothetical protein